MHDAHLVVQVHLHAVPVVIRATQSTSVFGVRVADGGTDATTSATTARAGHRVHGPSGGARKEGEVAGSVATTIDGIGQWWGRCAGEAGTALASARTAAASASTSVHERSGAGRGGSRGVAARGCCEINILWRQGEAIKMSSFTVYY